MATSLVRPNHVRSLDPFRVMQEMERQMWDWMNAPLGATPFTRSTGGSYVPPVDLYETAEDILVAASLPGIDASKVNVQVSNGVVTIAGEQQDLVPQDQDDRVASHYTGIPRYGTFSFSVSLPCEVEAERAEARYVDGILRIRFPKAQRAKPVQISVNAETSPAIEDQPERREIEGGKGRKK